MLASEVIEHLQKLIAEHGDLDVYLNDCDLGNIGAACIRYTEKGYWDAANEGPFFMIDSWQTATIYGPDPPERVPEGISHYEQITGIKPRGYLP